MKPAAVHHLESHPNCDRIQKLLYFVYTDVWIADKRVLEGLSISHLLQQLVENSSSIQHLKTRLIESAELLNKPDTYVQLAHHIIDALDPDHHATSRHSAIPYDRFQLRYTMMQVINPWKAKAILISLYHAKASSSCDAIPLSILDKVSLDELLKKVMDHYPSLDALDSGLKALTQFPDEFPLTERRQLGETLKEALRPYLPCNCGPEADDLLADSGIESNSIGTALMPQTQSKTVSQVMDVPVGLGERP